MQQQIKRSNVRYGILVFLFLATVFNYADRATLSVVAPMMSKELGKVRISRSFLPKLTR